LYKFLIQTERNELTYDFAFHLKEAIKYQNWYYNQEKFQYLLVDNILGYDYSQYVPVGSIDFVLKFYKQYYKINGIKPIGIPDELNKIEFTKRKLREFYTETASEETTKVFAKSKDNFKDYTDIVQMKELPLKKKLIISPVVKMESEWRAFVYNGKLVDLRNYNGDFAIFPNMELVNKMINAYTLAPKAYTIDVAIDDAGDTIVVEVHQFFSCGLYGFSNYKILPDMFIATHKEILNLQI
jgi:hypothetical protein